jgi:signal peptidase
MRTAIILAVLVGLAGAGMIQAVTGRPYFIVSGSMEPAFHPGDLFWLRPADGFIRPGTVVTFRTGEAIITHRVISVEGETLTTQGDGNGEADPWSLPRSAVLGIPAFRLPYVGWLVDLARRSTGHGFVALVFLILLLEIRRGLGRSMKSRARQEPVGRSGILLGDGEGMATWRATGWRPFDWRRSRPGEWVFQDAPSGRNALRRLAAEADRT